MPRYVNTTDAPSNIRAIWDYLSRMRSDLTTAQATITKQASTISTLQTQLAQTDQRARAALSSATTPTPTTTGPASTVPTDGPRIPAPGSGVPDPPNGPPIIETTMSTTDVIPIGSVTVENSLDPSGYAQTATISLIDWQTTGVLIYHDKQLGAGRWPDQPFGTGSLQYTLWLIVDIGGVKYGSGVIQYWYDSTRMLRNGGPPQGVAKNWFYDGRWGPLAGYQPAYGENVWMMVTAGNARNNATTSVAERSQIVQITFPSNAGGQYTTP